MGPHKLTNQLISGGHHPVGLDEKVAGTSILGCFGANFRSPSDSQKRVTYVPAPETLKPAGFRP